MRHIILFIAATFTLAACNNDAQRSEEPEVHITYPQARKDTTMVDSYFGFNVADPYRWLENDTSSETTSWVQAQNKVTRSFLARIPFREALRKRYETLYNYEKYSAPFKEGAFTYYFKNNGLQNQSVLYRETADRSMPEVFLDPNTFSADGTTSLSGIRFSKDGTMAACNISEGGSDWQKLVVIDAKTKKMTGDTIELKFSGASWKGNTGFYYSSYGRPSSGNVLSARNESHKLYFHKVGAPQSQDQLIYGDDKNPIRYMSGYVTENERFLVISLANATYGNALYVQDLSVPNAPIRPVISDMKNNNQIIDADDAYFYIETDKDAPTGKLVVAPIADPQPQNWKTIIPAKPEVLSSSTAGGSIFCSYLKDAVSKVYQYDRKGTLIREIVLPGPGTASGFSAKKEEATLYYTYTSYIQPRTIYKLAISSGESSVFKTSTLAYDPAKYESVQLFYPSKDGTKIPMIVTHKKGIKLDGKNPCLLYGYGGFSISLTPSFNTSTILLLENGGIYAVPNLRGGGEYGEEWHQQGIQRKKQNVFDDFMAAADYLVEKKYTSRDRLGIEGGSNGGLLVGACITQQPSMCKVAFPAVGVLDMLRYHKFTAGAGWAYDYGTAEDSKEMFDYLYKYSPLHNIKEVAYPATFITTADHDDRVVPAHSFKFAATLQEKQKGDAPVLISIETKAGHGSGRSTQQIIEEGTNMWSFFFYSIGVSPIEK